jgi:uncharacterized membrane protein
MLLCVFGNDNKGIKMNDPIIEQGNDTSSMAKLVYLLYVVSIFVGLTGLVGVIIAYINKSESSPWLQTHYQFQIRTFWISILFTSIAIITMFILIGFVILFATLIWLIVRCVKGYQLLEKRLPHPDPTSWGF